MSRKFLGSEVIVPSPRQHLAGCNEKGFIKVSVERAMM